ncbi:MAG TPA: hypothetical protein PKH94_04930 [Bacteroidales bacterium]|nr:hypothetical protein [Bacteroidales bacterium]HNS46561.1 hypothetical protein [Bacteroidales bacterium]
MMGIRMKKAAVLIIASILVIMVISSCKTREKCPAYGETQKFQIEQKY